MRIHDFGGADFEPVSKMLGACWHERHGERSYWHGADDLCVGLSQSDHGFVAQDESGAPVGVILLASAREEDHNRDLRMHWHSQRTIIGTICRSLGFNPREDAVPLKGGDEDALAVRTLGDAAAKHVVLFATSAGAQHERVARELVNASAAWLMSHGVEVTKAQAADDAPMILPSDAADDEAVGDLLNAHAARQGVDFVAYNYHIEEDGKLVAGIVAWALGSDIHIDMLAVAEERRRDGLGSLLLSHVEEQARKAGCTTASVDTFSYQAPQFYPKHGYEVVFRYPLDDGSERIYFKKRL